MADPQKDPLTDALGKRTTLVLAPQGMLKEMEALCTAKAGANMRAVVVENANYLKLHVDNAIVVPTSVPTKRQRVVERNNTERTITEESFDLKLAGVVAVRDHFDDRAADGVGDVMQESLFAALAKLALPLTMKRPNGATDNALIGVGLA